MFNMDMGYHFFYGRNAKTELTFVLWPRYCKLSGRRLWLERCYKQTITFTGKATLFAKDASKPIAESRYYDKHEYLLAKIRGDV